MEISEASSAQGCSDGKFESNLQAALHWFTMGFKVIPAVPNEKRTAVKWGPWLSALNEEAITAYWSEHPDHEIAAVIDDSYVVFDVDSAESKAALLKLEQEHAMPPLFTVTTTRGEHHYFSRPAGVFVKTDNHDSKAHPERIDVKAAGSLIHLPPSGGRQVFHCHAKHVSELPAISQDFADAAFRHNGREVPRPVEPREYVEDEHQTVELVQLKALVDAIDPDSGYDDWTHVGMALFHETGGSDAGLALFDAWSAKGDKYPGTATIEAKWRSFSGAVGNRVTIGTLIMLAKQAGADVQSILAVDDDFKVCDAIEVDAPVPVEADQVPTLLDRFSITGQSAQIALMMVAALPILGYLALAGRMTVWYAASNTGKTLLTLSMLIRGILDGSVDASRVFYVDVDDNLHGLHEKLQLAEEFGFAVLSDGFNGFKIGDLLPTLVRMADTDTAKGVVVILDTLKQFVDLMDKRQSTQFMMAVRKFVAKGGTFIGLAHTNKRLSPEGMPIFAGTTDVKEAVDCVYIIREIDAPAGETERFIEFVREKDRGGGSPERAAFAYSREKGLSYAALVASVREVDLNVLEPMKQAAAQLEEAPVIEAIKVALGEGISTKMKLATHVSKRTPASRAEVIAVIDKYTGNDPAAHHWRFEVGARGAHVFVPLNRPEGPPEAEPA